MDAKIQNELDVISDIIVKTVPVDQIYLFGSYAYGTPNEDSDLDIYVVLKDDAEIRDVEAGYMIDIVILEHRTIPTDILVKKKTKFQFRTTGPTIEREILNKGIKLYGQ